MAVQAHATAKYVRTSAQKAGLVLNLIRGRDVNHALATLRFARKGVARDIEKVLRSAIANASQKDGFGGDVERLFVTACYANQGPSQKRIRPAPMGRAFRVLHRTAHLTVAVTEKAETVATATTTPSAARRARVAKSRGEAVETPAPAKSSAARERRVAASKAKDSASAQGQAKKPAKKKSDSEKGE
jgi:large subunit ribosomal protein L22